MWGTDAVHGHSNIIGATLFPHNIGLGAAHDPDLIERIGAATAVEVRTTGMEWTFAPTLTVPQDYRWGRAYEGYSSDPALVSAYAGRMIRGLQGPPDGGPILAGPHVLASTKHFVGDGATDGGRDQGDATIDETTLRTIHGAPYVQAIEAGVGTIMTSFSSWQGTKIAGNRGLITDVLKGRMGFGGFVITDWNAHGQIAGCSNASCPQAINAGIDMYMAPDSWRLLYASLVAQVRRGEVPMARLDDAVARILRTKFRLGLFEAGPPSTRPYSGKFELLGSAEHRAVARQAVRESLVLLKDDGVLPIRPGARVLVAGDGADDIARQAGGWTLSWQGTGLNNAQFPGATSIWQGLKAAIAAVGGTASLSPDGHFSERPDVAVVVFGETPYAEFQGDLKTLQLRPELRAPWATMARLKAAGVPVVAVMLTGRPLYVNPALNLADAFVVAWLPGSEGEGVADLLVTQAAGAATYAFTGRLPAAWPATALPGGPDLYARGYGLARGVIGRPWQPLAEDTGVVADDVDDVFLDKGLPGAGWSLVVSDGNAPATRITTVPGSALGGRVIITATDHEVQEGARRIAVSEGPATVELVTGRPLDLSRQTNGDIDLLVTIRVDLSAGGPMSLGMRCGPGCGGIVTLPAHAVLPPGRWQTIGIPLKCFARAGADMARVDVPFEISTSGRATYSLTRVTLGTVADTVATCAR
jgi:beta-glucosidase